jgi:hypothetical protein
VDVFDEQTGAPLEGAFFEMDTLAGWQARVPLDAQEMGSGGYALQLGLWNGSIALMLLRAGRQGYASRDLLLWRPDRGDSLYHLGRGERFPLALGRGATICGHVRSSGRPEPGAVLVVEPASSCLALTATTGPDGAFEVAGIDAAGSAIVHVYDRALDPVTTVSLRLQHGERRTIEINAPGTTAIEGRVVLGGAPAANAEVMLSGATQARSATGPDGSYRIEGLNAGCHEVQVSASGGYLTRRVTVAESQSVRLDIATTCTISGVVVDGQTGLPVLDPYLAIEARRSGAEDRAIAFGSRFRLHVDAGTHRVDCLSERVHPGEPPTVEATAGDSEIVLRIFQGLCAVTLDVRDGRTNENVPACVYEYKTGGIHRGERPRAGEEVTIRDLRPGVYRFRIWSDAHAPAEVEVTLDEGQQVRETIALPRADGVRIVHVVRDTEAARAGLRAGDRILSWNGVATPSIAACYAASDGAKGTARIEFERDGKGGFIDVPTGSLYLDLENVPLDR